MSRSSFSEKLNKFHESSCNTIFQYNFLDRFVGFFYLGLTHIWNLVSVGSVISHFRHQGPMFQFNIKQHSADSESKSKAIMVISLKDLDLNMDIGHSPPWPISTIIIEGYLWVVTWLDYRIWTEINVLTSNLIWLGSRIWIETLCRTEILHYLAKIRYS